MSLETMVRVRRNPVSLFMSYIFRYKKAEVVICTPTHIIYHTDRDYNIVQY